MYSWNKLSILRCEYLKTRRKLTHSKGDAALHKAWKTVKSALRRVIKKIRLDCCKDLISEVDKDPWDLPFKMVTKRVVTRRRTPVLDNPDRVR